jgi:hypothetical protein
MLSQSRTSPPQPGDGGKKGFFAELRALAGLTRRQPDARHFFECVISAGAFPLARLWSARTALRAFHPSNLGYRTGEPALRDGRYPPLRRGIWSLPVKPVTSAGILFSDST